MNETLITLEEVRKTDNWVLWQIEDLVAERWSQVFCAPSVESARRQYLEVLSKQNSTKDEIKTHLIAAMQGENLFQMNEVI